MAAPGPLAELHAHYGGCLRPAAFLDRAARRAVDWAVYEERFRAAYGRSSGLAAILRRYRAGEAGAQADFARLFTFAEADAGAFARFQAKYDLVVLGQALSAPAAYRRLTVAAEREVRAVLREIAADQAASGVGLCELRFLVSARRSPSCRRQLLRVLLDGCRQASAEGCDLRLVVSLPREQPLAVWPAVAEAALGDLGAFLVGVDLCGSEEGHPPALFTPLAETLRVFNRAHAARALALLVHVGETFGDCSAESAVRRCQEAATVLGAHRLGHAIALGLDGRHLLEGGAFRAETVAERLAQIAYDLAEAEGLAQEGVAVDAAALHREQAALAALDPARRLPRPFVAADLAGLAGRQRQAMRRIAAAGASVEVCPTSNLRIAGLAGGDDHPVHRFAAAGVPFTVGADDPGLLDVRLDAEFDRVAAWLGLDGAGRQTLARAAWDRRSEVVSGRAAACRAE